MVNCDIELQLSRIEEIQGRLRQVIQDGTLSGIEELCEELSSRLQSVIDEDGEGVTSLLPHRVRFLRIAQTQDELARLGIRTRDSVGEHLGRTRTACRAAATYAIEPARASAMLRISTDITS